MFVRIKGEASHCNGGTYYDVRACYADTGDEHELCASYSTGVLTGIPTGGDEDNALECHAWGYDGLGPQLLACSILAFYAAGGSEVIAMEYYKEFTTEVIANLPDNFELTGKEINRWLRNKQTKGKKNERKSAETKCG